MITRRDGQLVTTQILFNAVLHQSVGCRIPTGISYDTNGRKIVPAGMPLKIDLTDRMVEALVASPTDPMNAVLAHDVDVTEGTANATAVIFGFINLARLRQDIADTLMIAKDVPDASKLLTFLREE